MYIYEYRLKLGRYFPLVKSPNTLYYIILYLYRGIIRIIQFQSELVIVVHFTYKTE